MSATRSTNGMIRTFDAVVIGSGAFGASTAYHLQTVHGLRVALLDKYEIASQTSPRAAGLTRQCGKHADLMRITRLSVEKFTRFSEETGAPLDFHQSGSVNIARTTEHAKVLRQQIESGRAAGLDVFEIGPDDLARIAPYARPDGVLAMWYTPSDMYLEPSQVARGYAQAAERAGALVLPHTAVEDIQISEGVVTGVTTDQGMIEAPVIVDAAGAWARLIADDLKVRVPMVPVRHQLLVTEPIAGVEADHAICRVMDARVYVRPDRGGLMLGGYELDPRMVEMRQATTRFQISDLELDERVLTDLANRVRTIFPALSNAPTHELRGGLPTMTPDDLPIVGPVPGIAGFFIATGCCVGGLSTSPGFGQALAELVVTGVPSIALEAFSLERFAGRFQHEDELLAACLNAYGSGYSSAKADD